MKTKSFREIDLTKNYEFFRWSDNGRKILTELLVRSDKDPKDFVQVYDELLEYLEEEKHMEIMAEELKSRNVQCINFYDVVLDYILIDSFEVPICWPICLSENCKQTAENYNQFFSFCRI